MRNKALRLLKIFHLLRLLQPLTALWQGKVRTNSGARAKVGNLILLLFILWVLYSCSIGQETIFNDCVWG